MKRFSHVMAHIYSYIQGLKSGLYIPRQTDGQRFGPYQVGMTFMFRSSSCPKYIMRKSREGGGGTGGPDPPS